MIILHADVLSGLDQLPPAAADCVVTSPPYWRLRQYAGVAPTQWADGQLVCLGAEADPDSFVRHLVQVFQGVRLAMADHACLFVNLGETYHSTGTPGGNQGKVNGANGLAYPSRGDVVGLQEGDRCGIPERFAIAMQADGWVWRDTIMWVKRSPMPMSRRGWSWRKCRVKVAEGGRGGRGNSRMMEDGNRLAGSCDTAARAKWSPCPGCPKCIPNGGWVLRKGRFATTNATEPIFMFVKGGEYFCDSEAASEPVSGGTNSRGTKMRPPKEAAGAAAGNGWKDWCAMTPDPVEKRLPRNYMLLSSEPTKEKHFAAFPSEIPRRLITMATSQGGYCSACGVPFAPMVESERVATRTGEASKCSGDSEAEGNRDPERHVARTNVLGYRACCTCNTPSRPGVVLDPFAGTGTTLRAAHQLGRDYIGIEASAHYLPIIEKNVLRPLPSRDKAKAKPRKQPQPHPRQSTLFAR